MKDRDQAVGELRRSPLLVTASSVSHRPDVGYQEAVRLCRLRCRLTAYSCCVDGGVTPLFVNTGCSRASRTAGHIWCRSPDAELVHVQLSTLDTC